MLIYGINVSEMHPTEAAYVEFLHKLSDLGFKKPLDEYELVKDEMTCKEFVSDYEGESTTGLSALLAEAIEAIDGVNANSDNARYEYVGLALDAPWYYNEKTRNITQEEYDAILRKYVDMLTDEAVYIRTYTGENGADY